jgi:hypothetical protein
MKGTERESSTSALDGVHGQYKDAALYPGKETRNLSYRRLNETQEQTDRVFKISPTPPHPHPNRVQT